MKENIHIKRALDLLNKSKLKNTKQRLRLIEILFKNGNSHFTAEQVFREAKKGNKISLATVYNCLNQFVRNNIINVVKLSSEKFFFDTNMNSHYHFFCTKTGELKDIPYSDVVISKLPDIPNKKKIKSVDIVINISD